MRVRTPRGLTRISREACCRVIGIKMANGASIKGLTDFRLLSSRAYKPMDEREPAFVSTFSHLVARTFLLVYSNRGETDTFFQSNLRTTTYRDIRRRCTSAKDIEMQSHLSSICRRIKLNLEDYRARRETERTLRRRDTRAPNMRIGRRINSPIWYLLLPDERPLRVWPRGPDGMLLSCVTIVGQRVTSVLWVVVRYEHIWTHAHAAGAGPSTRHALAFCLRGVWI